MNKGKLEALLQRFGLANINVIVHSAIVTPCIAFGVEATPSHGHWVVIEQVNNTVYLYDSYGIGPGTYYQIPGWATFIAGKDVIRNVLTTQWLQTNYCGLYCIAFLVLRQHYDFMEASDILAQQLGPNRDNRHVLAETLGLTVPAVDTLVEPTGSGLDIHALIGKLPFIPPVGDLWPPNHLYLGPYNPLSEQVEFDSHGNILKEYVAPLDAVDRIAQTHDIAYSLACNVDDKLKADKVMVDALNKLPGSQMTRYGRLAKFIINSKQKMGI